MLRKEDLEKVCVDLLRAASPRVEKDGHSLVQNIMQRDFKGATAGVANLLNPGANFMQQKW